jgi:predicted O-methyltransferase YrrM
MEGFQRWLPELREVVSKVWQHQGHQGGVSMEDGMVLYGLTRGVKPDYVIETGVAAGVSTSFICAALIENEHGMLYSIELPPAESASRVHPDGAFFDWPESGPGWGIPEEVKRAIGSRHTLILQDVREALPALLEQLPYIDLFFHDDLHTPDHMLWEFELVWPRLRPAGFIVADDVNFGWIRFSRKLDLGNSALNNIQRLAAIRKG